MHRHQVLAAAALAVFGFSTAEAQDWPNRPVTMVIAFAPGGPLDTLARNLQPYLIEALGQQVMIENVPGGGGAVGSLRVSTRQPTATCSRSARSAPTRSASRCTRSRPTIR